METSEKIDLLAAALVAAQSKVGIVVKDARNPKFSSSYASLAAVREAALPAFNSAGICIIQSPGFRDGMVTLSTRLLHSSGQWMQSECGTRATKDDAQGYGSAITYLRRYSLAAICGLSQDDDDGNAAAAAQERASAELRERLAAMLSEVDSEESLAAAHAELSANKKRLTAVDITALGSQYKVAAARLGVAK